MIFKRTTKQVIKEELEAASKERRKQLNRRKKNLNKDRGKGYLKDFWED